MYYIVFVNSSTTTYYQFLHILVDVQLSKALWRLFINEDDVVREILALCSRLEVLCVGELKVYIY